LFDKKFFSFLRIGFFYKRVWWAHVWTNFVFPNLNLIKYRSHIRTQVIKCKRPKINHFVSNFVELNAFANYILVRCFLLGLVYSSKKLLWTMIFLAWLLCSVFWSKMYSYLDQKCRFLSIFLHSNHHVQQLNFVKFLKFDNFNCIWISDYNLSNLKKAKFDWVRDS